MASHSSAVSLQEQEAARQPGGQWHRRGVAFAAATLLVASTLLFTATDDRRVWKGSNRDELLSAGGGSDSKSLMMRAAARVNTMLAGSNPAMALDAREAPAPAAGVLAAPSARPPQALDGGAPSANLAGIRAKLRAQMLAKYNAVAEGSMPLASTTNAAAPHPALTSASLSRAARIKPEQLQSSKASAATEELAQVHGQTSTVVDAPPSSQSSTVPQPVVQQMEAEIAQLQAKVQSLEQHKAASAPASPVSSAKGIVAVASPAVALSRPTQTKEAAHERLVAKAAAAAPSKRVDTALQPPSIKQRAATAVDKLISTRSPSSGSASDRAASMVDRLIAGRLAQREGDEQRGQSIPAAMQSSHAAAARSSAGGFSVNGAYGPSAGPAAHLSAAPSPGAPLASRAGVEMQSEYRQSQYPQAAPVQYPDLQTEGAAPAQPTSANLAAMQQAAPLASPDAIYYPGEQQHLRADAAMTPQALAQPNLPSNIVQQYPKQERQDMYDPKPPARPPLPDPMPTGYGATSTSGVQDHLFDIYTSKKVVAPSRPRVTLLHCFSTRARARAYGNACKL